jgi:hypothetical protein
LAALELHEETLEKLLRDPVLAAYATMGMELDWFQNIRLRYNWFVPQKIDSSGWGTGKTIGEWVYAVLRAMLIPGNQVGVYYPIFATGKATFWKYFNTTHHPVLDSQYKSGKNEYHDPSCWRKVFKNGSEIFLPAPGFTRDAESQVSQSFHTLILGEYTMSAKMGEGVDEMIGRLRGERFAENHPVWTNHWLLSAHAESPTHPSHRYYRVAQEAIAGQYSAAEQHSNVCYTFCYHDWSDKPYKNSTFKKKLRDEQLIRRGRALSKDEFRRRLLGLWTADGKGWYPEDVIKNVLRSHILPIDGRTLANDIFVLGQDIAPGQSGRADESASKVWRIREVGLGEEYTEVVPGPNPESTQGARYFHIAPVFSHVFKNVDAPQISGFIHMLHRAFNFSLIVLDPGGGGLWVYKELLKPRQLIHNVMQTVTPLCTREEPNQSDKHPIVVFFKRGSELDEIWDRRFLTGDEGIIEAAHREFKRGFEAQLFHWPQLTHNRSRAEVRSMPERLRWALIYLTATWKQLKTIRVKTTPDGIVITNARKFMSFEQPGTLKKDKAYAALYGYCGVRLILHRMQKESSGGGYEDEFTVG